VHVLQKRASSIALRSFCLSGKADDTFYMDDFKEEPADQKEMTR